MCTATSSDAPEAQVDVLLEGEDVIHCFGVYDGLSLAAAERAGAPMLYVSGYALSASVLGLPDAGWMTQTEMADAIARLCGQTDLPVLADADTGYGDLHNVARTMRLWERAGVAGLHIEDQGFPKACAQTHGVALVDAAAMVDRIGALLDARRSDDVLVIARTDACAAELPSQVVERCSRYAQAGADALFVNAPGSRQQFAELAAQLRPLQVPLVFNAVRSPRTPVVRNAELASLGVRWVLHPVDALVEAAARIEDVFAALARGEEASSTDAFLSLSHSLERRAPRARP